MAERINENIFKTRSDVKSIFEKEYSDKLTPDQKEKILEEYEKINSKLKEAEDCVKRKKPFKHTFKGLDFFKQLNGHSVFYHPMPNLEKIKEEKKDKKEQLENIWNQNDVYKVSFEELEQFLNPAMKEMFLQKCKYDRSLTSDVLGMTKVLGFVKDKQYDRAIAAMLYFGLEDRMHEMETYFNINLGNDFFRKVDKAYEDIKKLGLSEYNIKDMARENMKASKAMINKGKATVENIFTGSNKSGLDIAIASVSVEKTISSLPTILGKTMVFETRRTLEVPKILEKKYSAPKYGNFVERKEAECEIQNYIDKFNQRAADLQKRIIELKKKLYTSENSEEKETIFHEIEKLKTEHRETVQMADMLRRLPKFKHVSVNKELKAMEDLLKKREIAEKAGNDEELEQIDEQIKSVRGNISAIVSGKKDVRSENSYGEIDTAYSEYRRREKELRKKRSQYENSEDPLAQKEIKRLLEEFEEQRVHYENKFCDTTTYEAIQFRENKKINSELLQHRVFAAFGDGISLNDIVKIIRQSGVSPTEYSKILDSALSGDNDSKLTAQIAALKARLGSVYIKTIQNRKSISELNIKLETEKGDAKEKIINELIEQLYDRLVIYNFNVTIEDFEDIKKSYKLLESDAEKLKDSQKIKWDNIKEKYQRKVKLFEEKKKNIQTIDEKFEELKTENDSSKYLDIIVAIYETIGLMQTVAAVDYSQEELDALEQKFEYCENLITTHGLKGDVSFEEKRNGYREKIDKMKTRKKLNGILDPTEVILAETGEKQVALLREKFTILVGIIESGKLPKTDNRQIKEMLIEYKKIKELNKTKEDGLEDIEEMISVVENWSKNVDKEKFSGQIENLKNQIIDAKKSKNPAELIACQKEYLNLSNKQKVHPELLKEVTALYEEIEPEILRVQKEEVSAKLGEMKKEIEALKGLNDKSVLGKLHKKRTEFEKYLKDNIDFVNAEQVQEIAEMISGIAKEYEQETSVESNEKTDSKFITITALGFLAKLKELQTQKGLMFTDYNNAVIEYEKLKTLSGYDALGFDIKNEIEEIIKDLKGKFKIAAPISLEKSVKEIYSVENFNKQIDKVTSFEK